MDKLLNEHLVQVYNKNTLYNCYLDYSENRGIGVFAKETIQPGYIIAFYKAYHIPKNNQEQSTSNIYVVEHDEKYYDIGKTTKDRIAEKQRICNIYPKTQPHIDFGIHKDLFDSSIIEMYQNKMIPWIAPFINSANEKCPKCKRSNIKFFYSQLKQLYCATCYAEEFPGKKKKKKSTDRNS